MRQLWWRIAHRGASGVAPEHTRAAFELALTAGIDMIELDVQLTRDGVLAVIHDETLDRTTSGHGAVREQTWDQIRRLDAGGWFHPGFAGAAVLRLEEVLDLIRDRARLNVEIKATPADWQTVTRRLRDVLGAAQLLDSVLISSFHMEVLCMMRAACPAVQLGVLWHQLPLDRALEWAARLGAAAVHPWVELVDAPLVAGAHAAGLRVIAWTVNDTARMRQLIACGVDGIISDHPERFAALAAGAGGQP